MPMNSIWKLVHFRGLDALNVPDPLLHDGKCIGYFQHPDQAAATIQTIGDGPGFRDWPDGFRLLEFPLDRDFFSEGFTLDASGDKAISNDSSGDVGNDSDVDQWGKVEDLDSPIEGDVESAQDPLPNVVWELSHFKIPARSNQSFEELGMKVVGLYRTATAAKAAIARLRDKPGFAQWPGGWRIFPAGLNRVGWREGFVSADE